MTSSNLIRIKSILTAAVTVSEISVCLNLPSLNPRQASAVIRSPEEFSFSGLGCGQPAIAIAVKPLELLGHTTAGFGVRLLCGKRHADNRHGNTQLKTNRSHDLPYLPPNACNIRARTGDFDFSCRVNECSGSRLGYIAALRFSCLFGFDGRTATSTPPCRQLPQMS